MTMKDNLRTQLCFPYIHRQVLQNYECVFLKVGCISWFLFYPFYEPNIFWRLGYLPFIPKVYGQLS